MHRNTFRRRRGRIEDAVFGRSIRAIPASPLLRKRGEWIPLPKTLLRVFIYRRRKKLLCRISVRVPRINIRRLSNCKKQGSKPRYAACLTLAGHGGIDQPRCPGLCRLLSRRGRTHNDTSRLPYPPSDFTVRSARRRKAGDRPSRLMHEADRRFPISSGNRRYRRSSSPRKRIGGMDLECTCRAAAISGPTFRRSSLREWIAETRPSFCASACAARPRPPYRLATPDGISPLHPLFIPPGCQAIPAQVPADGPY